MADVVSSGIQPQTQSVVPTEAASHVTLEMIRSRPTVIVVIGMAGSGKTTFLRSLYNHFRSTIPSVKKPDGTTRNRLYTINLDPAVRNVPFPCNIDIRDSVKYKEVMKQYNLGPNGAIMTCLNLFATRFYTVLNLLEKRSADVDYVLIDTPGQIEVFNWSASGTIILDSLATSFPVAVTYVIDTVRCGRAVTFMSNMLYACSVLYKTRLPFIACFNKIDVASHAECLKWMEDYDFFAESVLKDESYMASLSRSCGLALVEFYRDLRTVGVSSTTGKGLEDFISAADACRVEYQEQFIPWLEHHKKRKEEQQKKDKNDEMKRFGGDLEKDRVGQREDKMDDEHAEGTEMDDDVPTKRMDDIVLRSNSSATWSATSQALKSSFPVNNTSRGLPTVRECQEAEDESATETQTDSAEKKVDS